MNWLNNIKLAPKILAALALMVLVSAGLVVMGTESLRNVHDDVDHIKSANARLGHAGRATANLLAFARNVELLPRDMSAEQRSKHEQGAADELQRFTRRLDALAQALTGDGQQNLATARAALDRYAPEYRKIVELSRAGNLPEAAKVSFQATTIVEAIRTELRAIESGSDKLIEKAVTDVDQTYSQSKRNLIVVSAVGGVAAISLALAVIMLGVSRPLSSLTAAMRELADGNFDVVLPGLGRRDEIGAVAQAVETFKVKATEKAAREAEAKQAEEARIAAERKADMHKLADSFEAAVGGIVETVSSASTELEATATTLTHTAERTQELSGSVAAASEQASTNVQSVASATDEMASSVNEISRQVQESSRIANEAVKQAERTDARIGELSQAAGRIGDVVKLITAIAEQTNLLALNATIEAARAGEAGRGFAVVAQEVKALAAQTAKATDEIGTQIAGMQTATLDSVAAIKEIGETINRVSEIAATIAAAVEEQGAATQEISRNVQQAARGTSQVASNIVDVNKGASETGSASSQVLSSAQELASEGSKLRTEVGKFLATVRAA
jgi:methyl-accepting chemotaxis protein